MPSLPPFFVNIFIVVSLSFLGMSKSFIYEPQPLTTYEGGQARFSCQINAVPAATVSWYKDGIELPQNDSRFVCLFFQRNSNLLRKISLSNLSHCKGRRMPINDLVPGTIGGSLASSFISPLMCTGFGGISEIFVYHTK